MTRDPAAAAVPPDLHRATRLVKSTEGLWAALGRLESWALREDLDAQPIVAPIYVTALARSGTTIVTEMLNEHPAVTAHRYADFPWVHTPYWRNWLRQRLPRGSATPVERAHQDRILVTLDSPEAVEEVLWMYYFPDRHRIGVDQRLGAAHRRPEFDSAYRDHIRKLLLVRRAGRYLAKGNYNVSRIEYLLGLFPDARFVVPVRRPLDHIASLVKQHRFFCRASESDGRIPGQLAASGHFEFGPLRRAIQFGDGETNRRIHECWESGDEARGWGLYWARVYGFLADLAASLGDAVEFVRYEDLCQAPGDTLDRIVAHCRLDPAAFAPVRAAWLDRLKPPDYYRPDFDAAERAAIDETTAETAARFGYGGNP